MKRTITAIAAFALLGLTACTPEEIQQAIDFSDAQLAAANVQPAAKITVDCTTANVAISNWPEGAQFGYRYGNGASPPYVVTIDASGSFDTTFPRALGGDLAVENTYSLWSVDGTFEQSGAVDGC